MRMSQIGVLLILLVILGVAVTVGMLAVNAPDPLESTDETRPSVRTAHRPPAPDARPGVVTGEVRIFKTDAAAENVVVRIGDGENAATARTDAMGIFRLRTLSGEGQTVVVEAPDPYAPVILAGVNVEPGRSTSVGTLYLEKAFFVKGVVVDGAGRAVPGAAVRVHRSAASMQSGLLDMFTKLGEEHVPIEAVAADADGAFTFQTLSPGTYTFEAEAQGYAVGFRPKVVVSPGASTRPVRIVLGPGETLVGSVKNAAKDGVAGARVTILRMENAMMLDMEFKPVQTVTGTDGTFEFTNLSPGKANVMVVAEGYPTRVGDDVHVGRDRRLDIVLSGTAVVEGTVRDGAGEPLDGVDVTGILTGKRGGMARITTGPDGRYRLENLDAGQFLLMASKDGYAPYPVIPSIMAMNNVDMISLASGATVTRDITLASGAVVVGRVTDAASGRPVAGAEVRAVGAGSMGPFGKPVIALTDAAGDYRIDGIGKGKHLLMVKATGYVHGKMDQSVMRAFIPGLGGSATPENMIDVSETGREVRKDLTISRAARLEGRVLTPDGKPVAGATVSVDAGGEQFGLGMLANLMGFGVEPALTNEDGVFSLTSAAGDAPVRLVAKIDGWVPGKSAPVSASSGAAVEGIEIRLGAPGTVEGVVLDEAGAPIAGAAVRAAPQTENRWDWETQRALQTETPATTDESGTFRLTGITPGPVIVQADAEGRVTTRRRDVRVVAGEVTAGVVVKLPKGMTISGRIVDEAGKPVADVHLWFQAERGEREGWVSDSSNSARTDDDGRFRADRLAAGVYTVNVNADDYINERLEKVQAGTTGLAITLKKGRTISGRVLDPAGAPAAGVRVSANAEGLGWEGASTDGNGEFEIDGLREGVYELRVDTRGIDGTRGVVLSGIRAGTDGLVIQLEPGLSISGIAVDENGDGVAGVNVWARGWSDGGTRNNVPGGHAVTDASGRFTISGLDSGSYRVSAHSASLESTVVYTWSREVTTGGSTGIRLTRSTREVPEKDLVVPVPEGR